MHRMASLGTATSLLGAAFAHRRSAAHSGLCKTQSACEHVCNHIRMSSDALLSWTTHILGNSSAPSDTSHSASMSVLGLQVQNMMSRTRRDAVSRAQMQPKSF
jgi:hypothetical protein